MMGEDLSALERIERLETTVDALQMLTLRLERHGLILQRILDQQLTEKDTSDPCLILQRILDQQLTEKDTSDPSEHSA